MSVIAFQPRLDGEAHGWTAAEGRQLDAFFAVCNRQGEVSDRAIQVTEHGDPQFFLFGPAPDCACLLSISRVAGRYVIENGDGVLLGEAANLEELRQFASRVRLGRRATGLVTRLGLAWLTFCGFVEERTEPLLGELTELAELLSGVAPQLAAFA